MANIPLQSISFPGLSDKYTTPVVDNTLTQAGAAADAKKTGDEIGAIKNDLSEFPNGTYPNMSVGNADQLTSKVGVEDNAPYLFRTSGGSNDIGDREDVWKLVGGTVAWNQLVVIPYSVTKSGITFTNNNNGSITINGTASSTVYEKFSDTVSSITNHVYYLEKGADGSFALYNDGAGLDTGIAGRSSVGKATADKSFYYYIASGTTIDNVTAFPQISDLTRMLGTSIADYVYSLEQATAGAGVAWLKKHFPAQFNSGYQAYDTGSLQSVSGLTMHRMIGFNQWDEEYEVGAIDASGVPSVANNAIRSKNFCRCVAGATYYMTCGKTDGGNNNRYYLGIFWYDADKNMVSREYNNNSTVVAPDNAVYFKITTNTSTVIYGATYNHDICINLHWDGEKDGQYEPYKEYTYALDSSLTLRGVPKLDANNNLYYDGDEYLPDGTVNRRYGVVDLGTLNWSYNPAYGFYCSIPSYIKPTPNSDIASARCAKYAATTAGNVTSGNTNKSFAIGTAYVYVSDDAYTDAVTFKTAMNGVYLVYELATPTTETALPYQETQIVDDFGTEEFVLADSAFPVPVGHETYYQNNLRAKLEMSPDSPDGDGLYVVQQESGENTYVPLASTATIQDILTRLTALENA